MSLNEMFMKEYKQKYLILRIFNVSGKEPQFYFIDPYAKLWFCCKVEFIV